MNAAIIAVGSEMLGIGRLDTNSLKLTDALERYGVSLQRKSVVGDRRDDLVRELQFVLQHHDLVITSGGLGPTEDDMTKDALAEVLGLRLVPDEEVLEKIRQRFAARGVSMPEVNRRQALVFEGNVPLENPRGTAPAFHLQTTVAGKPRDIFVFPGVPHELEGLTAGELVPWLAARGGVRRMRRTIRIAGLAESQVEERLAPFYAAHPEQPFSILAGGGEIQIHLDAEENQSAELEARVAEIDRLFADEIFGYDEETFEAAIGKLLTQRNQTLAIAESCTGGLLSSRMTDISGSSAYFLGGVVSYTGAAKIALLGVDSAVIAARGEVSEEVARQMAGGARERFGSTYGVGITGIAGPTGGSEAKPVGTVHIAVTNGETTEHVRVLLSGSRTMIKRQATQHAMSLLRLLIQKSPGA